MRILAVLLALSLVTPAFAHVPKPSYSFHPSGTCSAGTGFHYDKTKHKCV